MFIELPKVPEKLDIAEADLKQLDRWLVFLAARDDQTLEALKVKARGSQLEFALSEIEYAALSKKEKMLYDARIEGERIQRTILAENAGVAMAAGRVEGKVALLLRIAQRRFADLPSDLSQQLQKLPDNQLDELADQILDAPDLKGFLQCIETKRKG
jgi:hypothetical protein